MNLIEQFTRAAAACGRSRYDLALEAVRLRTGGHRLGLSEYIDYQVYKADLTWEQKKTFGGVRAQNVMEEILIDDYSRFLSLDKVTMYALFEGLGLPIPRLSATYRSLRPASSIPQLHRPQELADFLMHAQRPIYMKRSFGGFGRGNTLVTGVDDGKVFTGNGKSEDLSEFVNSFDDGKSLGWVLQEPLTNHASIIELTGSPKISGIRFHTFLTGNGAVATKAIFKVNVGVHDSDNFDQGTSGNMLAAVNMDTGRVIRAVKGVGVEQVVNPSHPVTGKQIVGFEIPHWREAVDLVIEAQKAFPGFICPGWDIAICDAGVKILEVNAFGGIDVSQHAYHTGFIDPRFMALMKERQLEGLISAGAAGDKRSPVNHRLGIRRHHWQW